MSVHWALRSGASPSIVNALKNAAIICTANTEGKRDLSEQEARWETRQEITDYGYTTQLQAINDDLIRQSRPLDITYAHTNAVDGTDSAFPKNLRREGMGSSVSQLLDGCYDCTKTFSMTMENVMNAMEAQGKQDVPLAQIHMARLSEIEKMLLTLNRRLSRLISEDNEKATGLCKASRAFSDCTIKSYGGSNAKSQASVGSRDSAVPSLGKSDNSPSSQSTATTVVDITRRTDASDASYQEAGHDTEARRHNARARKVFGGASCELNWTNDNRSEWGSMGKVQRRFFVTDVPSLLKRSDSGCADVWQQDESCETELGKSRQPLLQGMATMGTDDPTTLAECQICVKSQKTTEAKLKTIIGVLGNLSVPPTEPGLRRFFYRIQKIARCLQSCHHGNVESFCATIPKLDVARFVCPNGYGHRLKRQKSLK